MNGQQKKEQYSGVRDQEIRAALDQHWAASDANDFETEHLIYHEDAVLDYPQSGERTRGRRNIQGQRASQPSNKRFSVRRIIGSGDLWVTEFVLTYGGMRWIGNGCSSSRCWVAVIWKNLPSCWCVFRSGCSLPSPGQPSCSSPV